MSDNASIPSPAIGGPSWRLTGGVLPEALTAFQTLILTIAVIALFYVHSSAVQRAATNATAQQARGIAERIAAEQELNPEEPQALLAHYESLFRLAGVAIVRLVGADGHTIASWPEDGPRPGHYTGAWECATRADSRVQKIEISLPDPDFTDSTTQAMYWGAPIVVLALLGQWWIYRRMRRHAQPLFAIQDNVERYASGMQQRFAALTLSDTLGHVAQAWNKLVSDVAELQAQLPREEESPSAALHRMESKFVAEVLDPLPIGVVRIAPDGMVQQANAAAARLLRAEGRPFGRKLVDWLGDQKAEEWLAACRSAGARAIVREVGGPEDRLALRIRLASIGGNGGDRLLIVEEAGRSCAEEPVEQHLLGQIAGQMRSPLAAIRSFVEALGATGSDEPRARPVGRDVILGEVGRLNRLAGEIVALDELVSGTACFEAGDVDLAQLVDRSAQIHQPAAAAKQASLTVRLADDLPLVRGDGRRIEMLLDGIVEHAVGRARPGGAIAITARMAGQFVRIAISDPSDEGAPQDAAPDPPVQSAAEMALPLVIARELARRHGGEFYIKNGLQPGIQFIVDLPLPVQSARR